MAEPTDETDSTQPGVWRAIRDSLVGKEHDYTKGSIRRAVLLLAVPMVLEMVMESLFFIIDIYFVGKLGDAAVAALGVTEAMLTLAYAIGIGLAMSTTAMVARRIGEKDAQGASVAGAQAVWLGLAVGVGTGIPAIVFAADLLRLMGASTEVIDVGTGYTQVMLGGNLVILLLFIQNAIFRGAGDASLAMRSLWLANGINILLDPCLIFGLGPFPELGLTGAAVATVIGRGTGVLYQFWQLRRGVGRVRLSGANLRFDMTRMRRLIQLSWGSIGQFLIATASWTALVRLIAPFGKEALAGYTIAIRIILFCLLPAWGLSNAAATLVGQNLGAGDPTRAERSVWITARYNVGFLLVVAAGFVTLAEPLVGLFTDAVEVRAVGALALRVIAVGFPAYALGMVMIQSFNGAGDTWTPTRINLVCYWVVQIPCAWLMAQGIGLGPKGVFLAVLGAEVVLTSAAVFVFRRGRWKAKVV